MRKVNLWKECCLILIGLILGCLYQKHLGTLPVNEVQKVDTVYIQKDTVFINKPIRVESHILSRFNVLKELNRQNVPHAKIVLAQSLLETGEYKSRLCKTHNNLFGLKKGNSYRKYNNYKECIVDYKKRISSRYKGGDYYAFLKRIGYAEDPDYTQKLKGIVNKS